MILVTVGTELPFNRMVSVVDEWAGRTGRSDVFAQIGDTDWQPSSIKYRKFLDPRDFAVRFAEASIIISHAGMGTILSALHSGKPILVVPRRASLSEHRNEHQLATAQQMRQREGIDVAFDEIELAQRLERLEELQPCRRIAPYADPALTAAIRDFIFQKQPRP